MVVDLDHISHSQKSMWIRCPRQWEYRYIYGLKEPPSISLIEGGCYHTTLEENFKQKIDSGIDLDFDICYDIFTTAWEKRLHETDEIQWEDKEPGTVKDEGLNLVGVYIENVAPQVSPLEVEREYVKPVLGTKFVMRLDVMDVNKVVIDHKTSSRSYNQDDDDKDPQASAVAFALDRPIVFYNHVALKLKQPRIQLVKTYRTRADIDWYQKSTEQVISLMRTGIAPPNEGHYLCSPRFCGYWKRCRGELSRSISLP